MPYSKQPSISTYQTKEISLIGEMNSRYGDPTKDIDYLNCFPEMIQNKSTKEQYTYLRKRSGTIAAFTLTNPTTRGIHYWEDQDRLYVAQGHDILIYTISTLTLLTTLVNVFPTTTIGLVGFTEFLYSTGIVKIVATDGTTLSTIDSANVVVASVDPDMPIHIPQPIYLDGYLFIVKLGAADLYNSDLNDPLSYTPGNFISSELLPDTVVGVARLNNYIVLFGSDSIEYFWDAANATGSPLQRNDTPVKLTGFTGQMAQLGNKIYFVGDNDNSESNVFVLEDFKMTPLGTEPIRRFLTNYASTIKYGNIVSIDGHDFYVLSSNIYTYALELETNLWHRWGYQNTNFFNIQFAINCQNGIQYIPLIFRFGIAQVLQFNPSIYQDNSAAMSVIAVLSNEEFETYNQKYMYRLTLWADKPTASSPVLVQWSDDDYQTFNTGLTVDLFQEMPCIRRMGRFRRRVIKLTHTANQPLRYKSLEADINMGQS